MSGTEGERVRERGFFGRFSPFCAFSGVWCYYPTTHIEKIDSRAIYGQLKGIPDLGGRVQAVRVAG